MVLLQTINVGMYKKNLIFSAIEEIRQEKKKGWKGGIASGRTGHTASDNAEVPNVFKNWFKMFLNIIPIMNCKMIRIRILAYIIVCGKLGFLS